MAYPIRTNKIKFEADYAKIDEKYDFFCVKTDEKRFSQSATVLDMGVVEKNVCSVKYESGNTLFVMLNKAEANHSAIKRALANYANADSISLYSVSARNLETHILLQLLLNAVSWSENPFLSFNNLTGRMYCFHPKNIIYARNGDQHFIKQIKCLEIAIDKQLCVKLNVRTFTNIKFKNKIKFGKRKFEEYPQYAISNKNTLKRKTKSDEKTETFILRQFSNAKSELPFMRINDIESFNSSKMGILAVAFSLFNKKYSDMVSIEFSSINGYVDIDHKKREDRVYKEKVKDILKKADIRIIDKVCTESSAILISQVQTILEQKYDIHLPIRKNLSKAAMNIVVIHNKDWYEGQTDQHLVSNKYAVQHITIEDFSGKCEFAVNTIINELIIKDDLHKEQLTVFDWSALHYAHDWIFGLKIDINEEKRYFFMTLHNNGTFSFREQKLDLFSVNEYNKYAMILDDKNVSGVVVNADGAINVIKETEWFTIPQIEQIQEHLQSGDNKLRSKQKEDELLTACLDIKYMPINDQKAYYFVGTIGEGMQQKIADACPIREIEATGSSPLFFNELLPLMNITFVRNGQLTVLPFPFKYLREWVAENVI